jgi:hypothetical protein
MDQRKTNMNLYLPTYLLRGEEETMKSLGPAGPWSILRNGV